MIPELGQFALGLALCLALVQATHVLIAVPPVDGSDPVEMSGLQEAAVRTLLTSDFAYWSALNTAPETLIGTLLATDPALLATVSQAERARAFAILADIMPIGARAKGMLNDARQAGHPAAMDFSQLRMPVLLISAEDDRFDPLRKILALKAKLKKKKK